MFEKFAETINNAGKAVGEKTKLGTDVVKANFKISSEERALNELYLEIGKTYYDNNLDNPCCETMKELFDKVSEKKASIEALKEHVRKIKGVLLCQNCGAEVDAENNYCGKCGAKIEKPEPVEEAPAEETEEVIDHEDTVEADAAGEEAPEIKVEVDPDDKPEE